jgi:outer membrane protein assembly factor BamB
MMPIPPIPRVAFLLAVCVASTLAPCAASANGGEWPMFRGDRQMRGVADGRLPDRPDLLWRFETEAPVNSSAVIAGGRVFVGSDDGNVYALDLKTGGKLWSFETAGPVGASPLFLRDRIYVGSQDFYFYCLDARDGSEIWKFKTGDKILSSANWTDTATTAGTVVLFGGYDNKLYAVSAKDGRPLWTYQTDNFINGSPAIEGNRAVFGGCDGFIHMLAVDSGEKVAEIDITSYIAGTLAVDNGKAYFGHYDNVFLCVDMEKQDIDWQYRDKSFPFFSSAALSGERVVFGGRDKRVHCVDRLTGEGRWTFRTGGQVDSSPVICDRRVVIGSDDGRLYILDLLDGSEEWSIELGRKIFATPAIADGTIVIGSNDGAVYAFGDAPEKKPD